METARDAVAAAVRMEMARRQMPGARLAAAAGMKPKALSRRLRGEVAFSVDELIAVAVALEVPTSSFLPDVAA